MTTPYLLADDLTGAMEAGAAFRAAGWKVMLALDERGLLDEGSSVLQVLSTETRNVSAASAGDAVRRVLMARREAGDRLLFKKIDSTLRGPIGAELSVLIDVLAPSLVVVCPANPLTGRTVTGGILYLDGVALEQTDFRDDPVWPAQTGDVRARLAAQGVAVRACLPAAVVSDSKSPLRSRIEKVMALEPGPCVLICDAATMTDIHTVVAAALAAAHDVVFVGSAALGLTLARLSPPPIPASQAALAVARSFVVFCGSRHPANHQQMEDLSHHEGAVVVNVRPGEALEATVAQLKAALDNRRPAAVHCSAEIIGIAPGAVADWMAELAGRLAQTRLPDALYLTGGETAAAVCRRLNGCTLEILRELEPGVIASRMVCTDRREAVVISKPGGYGNDTTMSRNFREITGKS